MTTSDKTNSQPTILALETSSRLGTVGLARGATFLVEQAFSRPMGHAVELLPTIQRLLVQHQLTPQDLGQIYVSTGPGSFTGLRIAITVARTLHQALGCQLIGVPTLDVLALNAPAEVQNLVVLLDAKRQQVFAARYARPTPDSPLIRTAGPALVDPAQFLRDTPRPVAILGEGIDYHRPALLGALEHPADLIELPAALWPPTAAGVHQLGYALAQRNQFTPPAELLPVYIRLAEAEEVYRQRHGLPL